MSTLGFWSDRVQPPIWKREKLAGCWLFQRASAEAIFIG